MYPPPPSSFSYSILGTFSNLSEAELLVGRKKPTSLSGDVKRIVFNWPIEHRCLNSPKGLSVSSDQFPQTEEGKREDPTTALQLLLPLPWPTDDFWV